jgi:hypothetical protein
MEVESKNVEEKVESKDWRENCLQPVKDTRVQTAVWN